MAFKGPWQHLLTHKNELGYWMLPLYPALQDTSVEL
jgi:hypothetical protein